MPQPPWAASNISCQGPLQARVCQRLLISEEKNLHGGNGGWVEGLHEGDVAVEVIVAQQARKLLRDCLQQETGLTIHLEMHKSKENLLDTLHNATKTEKKRNPS